MAVDPHSHVPIYEQIVEHIRGAVAAGVYRPDEALPSVRALALELVVNPNTVQRAYQELERQGLVYMRRGLGAFVAKDGEASASSRLEQAVGGRFKEGIQVAMAAGMSAKRIEAVFRAAVREVQAGGGTGQTVHENRHGGGHD